MKSRNSALGTHLDRKVFCSVLAFGWFLIRVRNSDFRIDLKINYWGEVILFAKLRVHNRAQHFNLQVGKLDTESRPTEVDDWHSSLA